MIQDLGELKKLLQLCRKQGVTEIEFDNIKLKLGPLPDEPEKEAEEPVDASIDQLVGLSNDLGVDPMAFYSVRPSQ